jgi:hypothetical protein
VDKLLIDVEEAERRLRALWSDIEAEAAKGPLRDVVTDRDMLSAIRASMASRTKTYVYVLPTQILAKLVQSKTDARCLQAKRGGRGAFDARTLCHGPVVRFDKEHENVLGGSAEPYVNNPVRVPELTRKYRTAQKDKDGWDALCKVVGRVERINKPSFTLLIMRQVLIETHRRLEHTHVTYPAPSRASHRRTLEVIDRFLSEKSGGDRMLAVVSALLETVKAETALFNEVRRARVTASDDSTGMVADIECYSKQGTLLLAVEVKDQQLTITHVEDKLKNARAKGVRELLFVVQQSVAEAEQSGIGKLMEREFASGQNIYVLDLSRLAEGLLALLGEAGRTRFLREVGRNLAEYALQVHHRRRWAELLRDM